jgi:hypothetical protein
MGPGVNLGAYIAMYGEHFHLPDAYPLLAVAGAAAGNLFDDGEPVWLVVVGAPSSGKGELLAPMLAVAGFEHWSNLTAAGLLTDAGTRQRGTGGVLAKLGERGTLVLTDMSNLFAERGDEESRLLGLLREVHDGRVTRHVGSRGGRTIEWPGNGRRGRVGLLAAATDVIDLHTDLVNAMGPRTLFARMPDVDSRALITAAARNVGRLDEVRAALATAAADLLGRLAPASGSPGAETISEARRDVADFVARARTSPVRRDGRILLIPNPEVGGRLYHGLSQTRRGLDALGCAPAVADDVERRVGLDSIPALKRRAIEYLATTPTIRPTARTVAEAFGYPTATILETLEDLNAYDVVERYAHQRADDDTWSLSAWARPLLDSIGLAPAAEPARAPLADDRS